MLGVIILEALFVVSYSNNIVYVYKNGIHFDHYHAYDSLKPLDALGNEIKAGHACFGTPIVIVAGMRVS